MSKKHNPDEVAVRALDAEWGEAARAKDIDRVITFYAKDGSVVWPGKQAAKGHAAIRAMWKAVYDEAAKAKSKVWLDFKPSHIEIASGRDMAVDFGAVCFAKDAKPDDTENVAKYLVLWKREHGTWKVLYDCWNKNGD